MAFVFEQSYVCSNEETKTVPNSFPTLVVLSNPPWPTTDGGRRASLALLHQIVSSSHVNPVDVIVLWSEQPAQLTQWFRQHFALRRIYVLPCRKAWFRHLHWRPEHVARFSPVAIRAILQTWNSHYEQAILDGIYATVALAAVRPIAQHVIYRAHNIEYLFWKETARHMGSPVREYAWLESWRYWQYEPKVWRQVDEVWTLGYHDGLFIRHFQPRVRWQLPNVNIPDGIQWEWRREGRLVTSWAWWPNQWGLRYWLKHIYPELVRRFPQWKWKIGGQGTEALQGRWSRLEIRGWVPDVKGFLEEAPVFFAPIWWGTGVRIKILEAMALGRVVVAPWAAMWGLPTAPHVHYIPVNKTPHSWTEAIRYIEQDPQRARQIGLNARHWLKKLLLRGTLPQQ